MPYMSLCVVMIDLGNLRDQIFPRTHPVRSLSAKNDPKPKTLRGRPAGRHVRLRRPDLIATATKSMDAFDLVSKERVNTLRPACRSCRQSSGC